jgi:hypothetical protein
VFHSAYPSILIAFFSSVGQTNFVASFIFFPQDSKSDLTRILNFTFYAGMARLLQYDSFIADIAYTPAVASLLQHFAYDFTGKSLLTAVPGTPIFAANRYQEMYSPLCVDCSMITILKLGKCHCRRLTCLSICCLLFAVCCLLFAVCCLLFAICVMCVIVAGNL